MKNKTKKIVSVVMLILLLLTSLPIQTFATFITDINSDAKFGVISGSLAEYGHELHYSIYDNTTYLLFCTQYGQTSPDGSSYSYNGDFVPQYKAQRSQYEKIAEYIYFGYTMKYGMGLPTSAEAKKAACATQQFVWEYIHNNIDGNAKVPSRDSWKSSYMSSSIYASWLSETDALYNHYHSNVSFNNTNNKVNIGESATFTDSNGVLKEYATFNQNVNGITFSHTQGSNDIVITVSENTNADNVTFVSKNYGIYQLMPNGASYNSSTMANYVYFHFNNGNVQDLIFSNYVDPSNFSISVEVQSGKILLQKTNNIGNAVANCVFELYKDAGCTQKVKTGTTGDNGQILFDKLKPMTYYIKEKSVTTGYLLNETVQKVNVVAGETANVTFKNNEPTGEIKIYKVNTNGDKVGGAEFTIKANEDIYNVARSKKFYSKGDVVAKITSDDETGIASIADLPLGKYSVFESQAPKGYLLNETIFNANLEYKDSKTSVIELRIDGVINQEPTGTIEIIKRDNETGSIAQGDATLENAIYKVFADEDIYNVAKTKKFYSKGDLVATRTMDSKGETAPVDNLPLGKYIVKEDTASVGYMLDKTVYNVELNYKDQYTKVIANKTTSNELVKKMGVHIFKSGIKINSGETPGLEGAEFTIKLNRLVEKAYSEGYSYAEVWNGVDENGNKIEVDSKRVAEAQEIAPTYATLVTDKDGNAYSQKNLPYGKYIVKETKTPKDYETANDFYFSITQDESEIENVAQKTKHLVVNNEQLEAYIKLEKQDAKTGKTVTLNSATFEIKAKEDIYDRATKKILYKKGETISQKVGSKTYKTFTTNSKNMIVLEDSFVNKYDVLGSVVTPLTLPVGSYEITEIKTPEGFLQLEKPISFKIEGIRDYDKDQDEDFIKEVIIKNEQPTGTLIVDKSIAIKENVDTSLIDISDLSGIEFKLTAKEDIKSPIDDSIIYEKGQEVKRFNVDRNGNYTLEDLPMGTYELEEIRTLDGLVLNTTKYEVKFTQKDLTTKIYEDKKDISNDTTIFEFSKKAVTGDDELIGAKLSVTDENGKIVDTWISNEKTHKIEGLIVGKTYTLKEAIAPDGYVKASEIQFKVLNTKEVQKVTMIDKIVTMTKSDIAGDEIEGAKLKVIDKDGNIIDSWTSTKESHNIKGLTEGETYILHEDYAPDGYVISNDVEFTVTIDKEIQKIEMIDKMLKIVKTDFVTGEELEGAKLEVIDKETGEIVDKWTSTKEPHIVTGLEENKTYILKETTAPYGYELTEEIEFTVTTDKETQLIEMKDMPILKDIRVIKVDNKTNEVIKDNFTFGIYEDAECTKLIKEIKSNKDDGCVTFEDLRYGTYYIKEIKAPKGYVLSDDVVKIEINDKGVFINDNLVEEQDNAYSFEFKNTPIETPNTRR